MVPYTPPMEEMEADAVVVGGGVVGCAVAMELASFLEGVLVLERLPLLGEGTSTRNSGVVHSGIYYKPGTRKARAAVEGNERLVAWCKERGVPYLRRGKLVVAVEPSDAPDLERLLKQGEMNGVQGLRILTGAEALRVEPNVACAAALSVPSAGILDAGELVKSLAREASARGADLLTGAEVARIEPAGERLRVSSARGEILARIVVNSAGCFADEVARRAGNASWRIYPCRGEYCEVVESRAGLVNGLVYPAGHHGPGLGVHFTKSAAGALLVGPNARYVDGREDYEGDRTAPRAFWESARRLVPALRLEDLRPAYAGMRAKLAPPGDTAFRDFVVEADGRLPGLIHLVGIESPGLTASLALAREVSGLARGLG